MAKEQLTDNQKRLQACLDKAGMSAIAYAAPRVPSLGNLTEPGLVDELGYVNEARKALEKTEKVLKERLKSMMDGRKQARGDNFQFQLETVPRTALNQKKAKTFFEENGTLDDYMTTSDVERGTVKRL